MPQALITINAVPGSNVDLPINTIVQLNNQSIGGELTFLWSILDQPPGPVDALSSTVIVNPTFTPKKEGSYLIRLIVNQGLADEKTNIVVAAVRQLKTRTRVPAAGETSEADAADGWAVDVNATLRTLDAMRADPGVIVVQRTGPAVATGRPVAFTGLTTIKAGLPGEEKVPNVGLTNATVAANVNETLGIMLFGVDGAAPGNNPAYVRVFGYCKEVLYVGVPAVRDPVYIDDAGQVSLTPGTVTRIIGHVIFIDGAGGYQIFVDGFYR